MDAKHQKPVSPFDACQQQDLFRSRRDLHVAVYNCKACGRVLGQSVWRVQPKWDPSRVKYKMHRWGMLVGQAPGATEYRHSKLSNKMAAADDSPNALGIAFSGPAGKKLRSWLLQDNRFSEKELKEKFWKTSVTKCYPGKGNTEWHYELAEEEANRAKLYDRKPTQKEIKLCACFLLSEINLVQPKVIVPIGRSAIKWFFPSVKNMDEVIAKRLDWVYDGRNYVLIPLPHPSGRNAWLNSKESRAKKDEALDLLARLWRSSKT